MIGTLIAIMMIFSTYIVYEMIGEDNFNNGFLAVPNFLFILFITAILPFILAFSILSIVFTICFLVLKIISNQIKRGLKNV